MSTSNEPAMMTPTPARGGQKASANDPNKPVAPEKSVAARNQSLVMALNMSWQLAIAVLVPIVAGVQIGKAAHNESAGTFVGLGIAVVGSVGVLWRTMQVANHLPVPKLTDEQKQTIRKQYEEEDNE